MTPPPTTPNTPPNPPDDPRDGASERDPDAVAVDALDERLSAALDGDATFPEPLDAAGARRRDALEQARDLLAVPPPGLDDLTRRRLLRTAVAAAPTSTSTSTSTVLTRGRAARRWRAVVVAAAVIAVVALAGVGIASLDTGSNDTSSKNASRADSETTARTSGTLDLHEISDPSVLRRRVEAALNLSPTATTTPPRVGSTTGAPSGSATQTTGTAPTRCVSTLEVPKGDTAQFLAIATFHGTPALVVIARDPSRVLVFVVATADCRLLSSQFLKQ
jgi:hypothetical protein